MFNAVGKKLKPKVLAAMTPKNMGAGLLDGGFFTRNQFDRNTAEIQTPLAPAPIPTCCSKADAAEGRCKKG